MKDFGKTSGKYRLTSSSLMPKEELMEAVQKGRSLSIGIPREASDDEKRVAITPESAGLLVQNGNEVIIQEGAGLGANYTDHEYSEHGAMITKSAARIFESEVIIKSAPFNLEEVNLMKGNQVVISFLNVLKMNEEVLQAMLRKKITALAFEKIEDTDGIFPVVESMSEIAGLTSVLIASEYLSNMHGGKGVMLGGVSGISPTDVVIIGANTAGEYAARAALGLGASVKIFDNSVHKLRRFQSLIGQRLFTSVFHPQVIFKALKSADVLIGAIELEDLKPWYYITEEMIKTMKRGSVVIDLSIDRGGCIETTECRALKDPIYEKHGVIHFSAWNIPSRVARTASIALSNICTPLLQNIADSGTITQILKKDIGLRNSAYVYNGILTNQTLGQKFGMLSKDLDLLLSAF